MESVDNLGLTPYNFEPEYTPEELENLVHSDSNRSELDRVDVDLDEWCDCSNCEKMQTSDENICCRECDLTLPNLDDFDCITEHDNFENIVLNTAILEVAYIQILMFKGHRGRAPEQLNNQQSRLTAYRQFVCWMMRGEKLGKGNRTVIPSCVVNAIRRKFPASDGIYTGFKTILDSLRDIFQ